MTHSNSNRRTPFEKKNFEFEGGGGVNSVNKYGKKILQIEIFTSLSKLHSKLHKNKLKDTKEDFKKHFVSFFGRKPSKKSLQNLYKIH